MEGFLLLGLCLIDNEGNDDDIIECRINNSFNIREIS